MTHVITYDLCRASADRYKQFIERVKGEFPSLHEHVQESVFLVSADLSAKTVYERVRQHMQAADRLFVGRIVDWQASAVYGGLVNWLNRAP